MLSQLKVAILEHFGPGRQYLAASEAGISESTLSRIILGRREASPSERRAIARALRRPQRDLFPGTEAREDAAA